MNITYRVVDPDNGSVRDQGLYDPRNAGERNHFYRIANKAYRKGLMVVTMATAHQAPMFERPTVEREIEAIAGEVSDAH